MIFWFRIQMKQSQYSLLSLCISTLQDLCSLSLSLCGWMEKSWGETQVWSRVSTVNTTSHHPATQPSHTKQYLVWIFQCITWSMLLSSRYPSQSHSSFLMHPQGHEILVSLLLIRADSWAKKVFYSTLPNSFRNKI